jgi:hypothetical protein
VERWQRFAGGKATREADKRSFDEIKTVEAAA